MIVDLYQAMGEFHDLFMADLWDRRTPVLASAFDALDTHAVLVDIGAGAGVDTRALRRPRCLRSWSSRVFG